MKLFLWKKEWTGLTKNSIFIQDIDIQDIDIAMEDNSFDYQGAFPLEMLRIRSALALDYGCMGNLYRIWLGQTQHKLCIFHVHQK